MIILTSILSHIDVELEINFSDVEVRSIAFDSRKVEQGSLFVAIKGTQVDGHDYIDKAIAQGAKVIVVEEVPTEVPEDIVFLLVKDSSFALGKIAAIFYDHPSTKLKVVGVTGTNGKTTCATLMYELFTSLGYNCGLLSTVENRINGKVIPSTHTTPDAISLQQLFAEMVTNQCTHCFMEVSSHSLDQNRVAEVDFDGGVFTNISHDHLDYHKTFKDYITAKKKLFDQLPKKAFALVNQDDRRASIMLQNSKATRYRFAMKSLAEFKIKVLEDSLLGMLAEVDKNEVWFKLSGNFNAYNLLSVYAVGVLLGENKAELLAVLSSLGAVNGRFEKVISPNGQVAIVDYAHTPDALENVLTTIQSVKGNGLVLTVVGCGGNRDTDKRPLMASIAANYSDQVILTSDNPRDEDPKEILNQMKAGLDPIQRRKVLAIEDREEAIKTACTLAQAKDIILVAGKGHETYQEIKGEKYPFDDKEILKQVFEQL